ncbi:unnamed protein product [marine sediment metagenome]|uniref:Uncharacterized protein n=1 Tax=marine sediment metagenome TaxID=412755 RepID=X1TD30_9ZZZZ
MLKKLKQKFVSWLFKGVHLDEIHIGARSVVISATGANLDGQKIENVGAPDSADDVVRNTLTQNKMWVGNASNMPAEVDPPLGVMDFWSVPQISVVVPAGALTQTLPDVVVAAMPGTVVKATAMFMFRMLDNVGAANKLNGAQFIQIQKGEGAFVNAISLVADQFGIAEATREGGTLVVGDLNVDATVDADATYGFQWKDALADVAGLTFTDLQMGIRIWYSI